MMYKVRVYREFTEFGNIEIEADDEHDAKEQAMSALTDGDEGIEWSEQDPGDQDVGPCRTTS